LSWVLAKGAEEEDTEVDMEVDTEVDMEEDTEDITVTMALVTCIIITIAASVPLVVLVRDTGGCCGVKGDATELAE
jgi:hypothetical protein